MFPHIFIISKKALKSVPKIHSFNLSSFIFHHWAKHCQYKWELDMILNVEELMV